MEEVVTESMDISHQPHEKESSVVEKVGDDLETTAAAVPLLGHTYYRCKHKRLWSALQSLGCSSEVFLTLLKARKPSTNCVYTRVWEKFTMFAAGKGTDPAFPSSSLLLDFLQAGLNLGLGLSSLKVQISAATNKRWSEDMLIIKFFKAVKKIRPLLNGT